MHGGCVMKNDNNKLLDSIEDVLLKLKEFCDEEELNELRDEIIKFQKERDWKKFHTPENLAKSISIEAAELLEHFQWGKEYDIDEVADELADVLNYCILMADALDLDVKEIVLNKMEKNALKYPVINNLKE